MFRPDAEPAPVAPRGHRRAGRAAVAMAGLGLFLAGCGGTKVEGQPTRDVCYEVEVQDELDTKMCDTFNAAVRAAIQHYELDDPAITEKSEAADKVAPGTYTFKYRDERTKHHVAATFTMVDDGPDLDAPYALLVYPDSEYGRSFNQVEESWAFYQLKGGIRFYTRTNGKSYDWDSSKGITVPSGDPFAPQALDTAAQQLADIMH